MCEIERARLDAGVAAEGVSRRERQRAGAVVGEPAGAGDRAALSRQQVGGGVSERDVLRTLYGLILPVAGGAVFIAAGREPSAALIAKDHDPAAAGATGSRSALS